MLKHNWLAERDGGSGELLVRCFICAVIAQQQAALIGNGGLAAQCRRAAIQHCLVSGELGLPRALRVYLDAALVAHELLHSTHTLNISCSYPVPILLHKARLAAPFWRSSTFHIHRLPMKTDKTRYKSHC